MKMIDKKSRKIILTGAGGFLGRNLLEGLLRSGHCGVVAITSKELGEEARESLKVVSSDDWEGISSALHDADILINSAFPRQAEGAAIAKGISFIDRVFELTGRNEGCAVINISSQSVYSQKDPRPATEVDELCLESSYAVAKYATELLLDARCAKNKHTNIRLASLIGPGFNQRVVNKMTARALRGEGLSVQENGAQFGYLDVQDAVRAIVALFEKAGGAVWERAYNVGPGVACSLTEIAETVRKVCGIYQGIEVGLSIEKAESPATYSLLNTTRFFELTGWRPERNLEETILAIVEDFKSGGSR